MSKRNIKLTIAYDGTAYHGWQRQRGFITVQQVLEEAISRALGENVSVRGSGRTDSGVHALGQVANFLSDTVIPSSRLYRVINKYLPPDVRVLESRDVPDDFDAIRSVKSKLYRYTVFNDFPRPLELTNHAYRFPQPCDVSLMRQAARHLVGEHDFASFTAAGHQRLSTVRTIYTCSIRRKYDFIIIDVEGGGFLYHMVRNIVGSLLEVGRGKLPPEKISDILQAKHRHAAGPMAPACGLCLQWVRY